VHNLSDGTLAVPDHSDGTILGPSVLIKLKMPQPSL
jgi:hypothetical protein